MTVTYDYASFINYYNYRLQKDPNTPISQVVIDFATWPYRNPLILQEVDDSGEQADQTQDEQREDLKI